MFRFTGQSRHCLHSRVHSLQDFISLFLPQPSAKTTSNEYVWALPRELKDTPKLQCSRTETHSTFLQKLYLTFIALGLSPDPKPFMFPERQRKWNFCFLYCKQSSLLKGRLEKNKFCTNTLSVLKFSANCSHPHWFQQLEDIWINIGLIPSHWHWLCLCFKPLNVKISTAIVKNRQVTIWLQQLSKIVLD